MLRGKWGHSFSRLHKASHPVAHNLFSCSVATAFPKSKSRLFPALQAALFQWWLVAHWCIVTCPGASVLNWHQCFQAFCCYPTLKLCRHLTSTVHQAVLPQWTVDKLVTTTIRPYSLSGSEEQWGKAAISWGTKSPAQIESMWRMPLL